MSSSQKLVIPTSVRGAAAKALRLKREGYAGGTPTGLRRAQQLNRAATVSLRDIMAMRAWFARHGPDAANGGTSYPGYLKFTRATPAQRQAAKSQYRGAVAWLLWGGTPAYRWVHSQTMERRLERAGFLA